MEYLARIKRLLEMPLVKLSGTPLTLMALIEVLLILVVAVVVSRMITRLLRRNVFERAHVSTGVQESISKVLHYLIMLLGGFIAIEHLGINLTALAAVGAVLMVGIGFGFQNVASNFISGLILLFERPIEVNDFVEVGGVLGRVRAIRARSTIVDTQDNVSIIVPNSNFISENVTNWSYRDPKTRIHIEVGVSYASDVEVVRRVLLGVGAGHPEVLAEPRPDVQFRRFGDSSLNFDLLCWIQEPQRKNLIRSDINFAIVGAFRENGIEIPFPQRDIHLRSAVPIRSHEE